MRKSLILLAAIMFSFCTSAFAADVSGDWTIEFTDIMGPQKWDVNFKTTGETLDVTVKNAQSGDSKCTGTLKGDQLAFTYTQKGGGGDMYIEFKGTVKGNKIEGTRELFADPSGAGYTGGAKPGTQAGSASAAKGGGGAPAGGQGAAPSGGSQGGGAPPGGQGGASSSGGPQGGSAQGGQGGPSQGGSSTAGNLSANTWSAVKK
jgi:hypothetical protein